MSDGTNSTYLLVVSLIPMRDRLVSKASISSSIFNLAETHILLTRQIVLPEQEYLPKM